MRGLSVGRDALTLGIKVEFFPVMRQEFLLSFFHRMRDDWPEVNCMVALETMFQSK